MCGPPFAWWVCELPMDLGSGAGQVIGGELPADAGEQHQCGDLVDPPQRGEVVGVEHVLRGKIPGIPG